MVPVWAFVLFVAVSIVAVMLITVRVINMAAVSVMKRLFGG